jgi:hypothetical protein
VHTIFAQRCAGCHIGGAVGGLNLDSYANAMKGGVTAGAGPVTGPVIRPGDAADSYLYGVLTGEQQPRMPLGGPPLSDAELTTMHDWIQQGAQG